MMIAYVFLIIAITAEVFGSTMLKLSNGFSRKLPIIGVILGFGFAFYFLSLSLIDLPLGFAYAMWSGLGTVFIAITGVLLFKETVNKKGVLGLGLLLAGVILLNLAD